MFMWSDEGKTEHINVLELKAAMLEVFMWSDEGKTEHINVLELKAAMLGVHVE